MAIIKCAECGKKCSDKAAVCVHCGCPIEKGTLLDEPCTAQMLAAETHSKKDSLSGKHPSSKRLTLAIILQVVLLLLSFVSFADTTFLATKICFTLLLVASVFSLVSAIKLTKHAKRAIAKKHATRGVAFTIINILLIVILVPLTLITTFFFGDNAKSSGDYNLTEFTDKPLNDEMTRDVYNASLNAAMRVRADLKSPNSFYANRVYVDIENTGFELIVDGEKVDTDQGFSGYYHVYIDYTAENSFGGSERQIAKFTYNQDLELFIPASSILGNGLDYTFVDSIPTGKDTIVKLNLDEINNFDYSKYE